MTIGEIETFPDVRMDKAQAVKVLEEASEVYAEWQSGEMRFLVDECADLLQATCNLLAACGVYDMTEPIERCRKRNVERGRFEPSGIIRCSDCRHAKVETHKGDDELVCWHHHPGYVTKPDGYCHRAERR